MCSVTEIDPSDGREATENAPHHPGKGPNTVNEIRTELRLTKPTENHAAPMSTLDAERRAAKALLSSRQDVRDEAINIACSLLAKVAERTIITRDVNLSPPAPHEEESVAARIVVRPHPTLLSGMLQVVPAPSRHTTDDFDAPRPA